MSESSQNHTKTDEKGVGAKNVPSTLLNRHQRRSAAYQKEDIPRHQKLGMSKNQLDALDEVFAEKKQTIKRLCTNAEVVIVEVEEDFENDSFEYAIENKGCAYDRRNGSKYCQNCSDQYHATKNQ